MRIDTRFQIGDGVFFGDRGSMILSDVDEMRIYVHDKGMAIGIFYHVRYDAANSLMRNEENVAATMEEYMNLEPTEGAVLEE